MKLTKEQRSAIIRKVRLITEKRYDDKVEEAKNKYIPSEEYKILKKALYDRQRACEIIKEYDLVSNWHAEPLKIDDILERFIIKELNIKPIHINTEELETELILNECSEIEELINNLVEKVINNKL